MAIKNDNIRTYACGGCGTNILLKMTPGNNNDVVCVDTSDSNLIGAEGVETYLLEGTDGAGKLRRTAYENFATEVEGLLINFAPSNKLNIVISSISGGSGSVIAPAIVNELLDRKLPVIVISVSSDETSIETENAIKTIQTYNMISKKHQLPVAMSYLADEERSVLDNIAIRFIQLLETVTNKQLVREFDTADLYNFINYNRVTKLPPAISLIDIVFNNEEAEEVASNTRNRDAIIASTILVAHKEDSRILGERPEYGAKALVVAGNDVEVSNLRDMRIDNIVGNLQPLLKELEDSLANSTNAVKSAKLKLVEEVTSTEDDGVFVL